MESTRGFYDFCVPYNPKENAMFEILDELVNLGYKTVAIEQVFDHAKKEKKTRSCDIFPDPVDINYLVARYKDQLRILQRLTITYVDAAVGHAMANSLVLKKYNLIAGQPKTDSALNHCCTSFTGDIITFDSDVGSSLLLHRKSLKVALQQEKYFEIKYSFIIRDSNNRKDMIKMAHNYFIRGKSKNIIMSSGALNPFDLRGPYDVANLAFIFGLSEDQGKNAVNRSCKQLFLRAEARRIGKTVMFTRHVGPIVFSDTSDEYEDAEKESIAEENESVETVEDRTVKECLEQPLKKKTKINVS